MGTDINVILASSEQVALEAGSSKLTVLAQHLKVDLFPVHPKVADADLKRYYIARVRDDRTLDEAIVGLRNCPGVEAAYIKPPDAPP